MSIDLPVSLFAAWHSEYPAALLAALVLLAILVRTLPDGRQILRNALVFLVLLALLITAAGVASATAMGSTAAVLDEIGIIMLGLLVIRLAGLTLFRVVMPHVGLGAPRILEDMLLVLAYMAWGLVRLRHAGLNFSGLITTSAVITGIIAFSMQETLGNILGGMALQLEDSVSIGDWIHVDDVSGRVMEVHWRHTSVRTRNGEIVVLPNSLLTKGKFIIIGSAEVPQWRRWVYFTVGFQTAPARVITAVEKALINADMANVSREPLPQCIVMDYKNGSTHYAVRYWLTNPQMDDPTDSVVRLHIYAALQREGIMLSHPNMDVFLTSENSEHAASEQQKEIALRKKKLRKVELFAHLSDEELAHLATTLTYAIFVRGDVITHQGAMAHWLYVLIKGEADIWYETPGSARHFLTTLTAGRVFGEMGLMTGEPRRATVTARTDAECYRIDKTSFESIMQSRPELAEQFANILTERNKQLIAVQQETTPMDHEQQRDKILGSIRRFFRLDTRR
jgi:small-conductance mechanosensitive channel/CRP-like cAMP-binding protein